MPKNKKVFPAISFSNYIKDRLKDDNFANAWEESQEEETIALEIKKARLKAGLSQKQLAEILNTTQSFVSDIENANYDSYSIPTLKKIAKALKLELIVRFKPLAS